MSRFHRPGRPATTTQALVLVIALAAGGDLARAGGRTPLALGSASGDLSAVVGRYGPVPGRTWSVAPVSVHATPGGKVLDHLSNGCTVSIVGRSGAWYRIVYFQRTAWVHSRGIVTMAGGPLGTVGVYRSRLTRDVDLCNIPGGPPQQSLPGGTAVQLVARTADWLLVETAEHMGYVPMEACSGTQHIRGRIDSNWSAGSSGHRSGLPPAHHAAPAPQIAGFRFPVRGGAAFGDDFGVGTHAFGESPFNVGIDLFAPRNTPILAPVDGVIERTETAGIGGRAVFLDAAGGVTFYFAHLERFAESAVPGRRVRTGDVLGYVGTTGNAAGTSPHLHFAAVVKGDPFDPVDLLREAAPEPSAAPARPTPAASARPTETPRPPPPGRPSFGPAPTPVSSVAASGSGR